MSLDTLVAAPVSLPRVNLLPPEVNAADAARRVRFALAGGLVAVVAIIGYFYMAAGNAVTESQTHVDAAQAATGRLKAQLAQHNTITPLKNEVQTRSTLLSDAMAQNVPWAFYMNDLQLVFPRGARLTTWSMQLSPSQASGGTTFGSDGVAAWSISGEAKSFEDVARVIEALQGLDQVDSVYVTSAADALDPTTGHNIVTFILTTRMNQKAIHPYALEVGH
jgi:Tfp pilus assembly protein PilN